MKIVFTIDSIKRGGKERQMFILAKELLARNHNICILSLRYSTINYLSEYGINRDYLNILENNSYRKIYLALKEKAGSFQPDIIISWDAKTAFFALIISTTWQIPFINASIRHGIRPNKGGYILRSILCHLSPNVMANSHAGLKANNLRTGGKGFVLYNGIENKFSMPLSQEEKRQKRNELLGKDFTGTEIFISVGNLVPYKDYFTVLKALNKYNKTQNFHYIILGEGPLRAEYEKLVVKYSLEENITFIGRVENVNDFLSISDYMIHSSRGEGISNAILEGMYMGLPIIATNVGGIPETIWHSSSVLFKYKSEEQLFNILMNLETYFRSFNKDNPSYLEHLEKFSVDSMFSKFQNILKQVTAQ